MDLGEIDPAWRDYQLYKGILWLPEGLSFKPGELSATWWNRQLIRELRRRLREPQQYNLLLDWFPLQDR